MLILASQSASRKAMLAAAGVAFEARPALLDERAVEAGLGAAEPAEIALALAHAKALAIEADANLVLGGRRFDKPESRADATRHLQFFSGRTMHLHSAAALARDGRIVWSHADVARLRVRPLSDAFITWYLEQEWPAVAGSVGVFRIEALGPHLFEYIEGDYFTVLGMPLLPVLAALREAGELVA